MDEILDQLDAAGLIPEERHEEFPVTAGRNPGYTPFEYVTFTDEEVHHDLSVQVRALGSPLRPAPLLHVLLAIAHACSRCRQCCACDCNVLWPPIGKVLPCGRTIGNCVLLHVMFARLTCIVGDT